MNNDSNKQFDGGGFYARHGVHQSDRDSPEPVYNGGLLRAHVRYFNPDNARGGLPKVASLVDNLNLTR